VTSTSRLCAISPGAGVRGTVLLQPVTTCSCDGCTAPGVNPPGGPQQAGPDYHPLPSDERSRRHGPGAEAFVASTGFARRVGASIAG
jgi:hypothetical protein